MSSTQAILDQLTQKASELYSLPAVAMKVIELTDNPQVDTQALKACIETDPALTAKVLRVVNSSLFGLSREVSDLNQALTLLGTKPLKLLVLGFSLPPGLFADLTGDVLLRYWRHTLIKAVAAREISQRWYHQAGDEAFIAGLLQDIGVLVLVQQLGRPYVRFFEKVFQRGGDLVALEIESLGFSHTQLSAGLLRGWHLPPRVVAAVAPPRENSAETSPEALQTLRRTLALAHRLAQLLAGERADALDELIEPNDPHAPTLEQLEELAAGLNDKVRYLADVLSVELPPDTDYRDVLVQAHARLAGVAVDLASEMVARRGNLAESLRSELESLADAVSLATHPETPRQGETPAPRQAIGSSAGSPGASLVVSDSVSSHPDAPQPAPAAGAPTTAAEPDPGVLGQVAAAVTSCRQSRCPLSIMLVEMNNVDDLLLTHGMEGFQRLRQKLQTACRALDHPRVICLAYREAAFAVLLVDCERRPAIHLGNQLIGLVRRRWPATTGQAPVSISVGVATVSQVPKNFPLEKLLEGADRCLYGSRASGGGVVKSIEIY